MLPLAARDTREVFLTGNILPWTKLGLGWQGRSSMGSQWVGSALRGHRLLSRAVVGEPQRASQTPASRCCSSVMEWSGLPCLARWGGDSVSGSCLSILVRNSGCFMAFHKKNLWHHVPTANGMERPFPSKSFGLSIWWDQWGPSTTRDRNPPEVGYLTPHFGPLSVSFMLLEARFFFSGYSLGLGNFSPSFLF